MKFTITCLFVCFWAGMATASDPLSVADSLFQRRNENFDSQRLLADTTNINKAIARYTTVLRQAHQDSLRHEALWKLLRAYYFKGQFGSPHSSERKSIYNQGIKLGESYVEQFPNSVELHAWLGIMWARWAEESGILAAARRGVAGKVKQYAEQTIQLDEEYLGAGGYRLLGMLHRSVPKIPFVLSWPSKERGLEYLQKAYRIAPWNLYNTMYLAEALYENDNPERAKQLCLDILNQQQLVHGVAVDAFIKDQAQTFLNEHFQVSTDMR